MADDAGQQQGHPNPNGGGVPDGTPPGRPDYLPEKFWKDGAPQVEALAKSYTELEKQRGKFAEEAKKGARTELEAELFGKRPEKPEAYEVKLPEDVTDVVLLAEGVPDGFEAEPGKAYFALNQKSEALGMLRSIMHRAGASPEEFSMLMAAVARENGVRAPTAEERAADQRRVADALGEHGQRRLQHTWGQMVTLLGKDGAAALDGLATEPKAVMALEELVARASGSRFAPPAGGSGPGGRMTEAEVVAMMRQPEYQSDPAFQAKVQQAWKTLYPE